MEQTQVLSLVVDVDWETEATHADGETRLWADSKTSPPFFFILPELTYQEVLSFKPLEPSQLPGTHEIEQ